MVMFLHFTPQQATQVDIADDLATNFRQGNSKEIAKSFAPSIELIIVDQEDVYNRAQAEQILKDFFLKNPPSKTSIIHKLSNSPNYRLTILSLTTKTEKFRVTVTMKKTANAFLITELRIETER
ncbi:MAG: DUF4783 domain-containing protein [Pedobacter sp.]|uniref:DUF4783 domain-containing protein n=1 Tax=Pedobacter sp. TaxID=1411316 RepID=UPI0028069F13|nr:DUF4783 domain-containing protein [Pedobacter sp.]MDQ8006649.1 DUF4783 domain-containing protein [Pedobacter sp.]